MTKKDFALDLKGCSKEDRKKVIKAAKSVGLGFSDKDRFKRKRWDVLMVKDTGFYYDTGGLSNPNLYQMPQDWTLIQEALGIEVPKHGEVWVDGSRIVRFEDVSKTTLLILYSQIDTANDKFYLNAKAYHGKLERKATPEETAKLIEAEHANGYHWDGKELVKIPEYFECVNVNISDTYLGRIEKFEGRLAMLNTYNFKPSTLEAFEAQEAKRNVSFTADDVLKVSDAFREETSKLRGRLLKKSAKIKDLESTNKALRELNKNQGDKLTNLKQDYGDLYAENEKRKELSQSMVNEITGKYQSLSEDHYALKEENEALSRNNLHVRNVQLVARNLKLYNRIVEIKKEVNK